MKPVWIRVASLVVIALLHEALPKGVYQSVFLAILFAHYALALFYSRRRVRALASSRRAIVSCLVLFVACTLVISGRSSLGLILLFGVHHAASEVYALDPGVRAGDGDAGSFLRASRMALNLLTYAFVLSHLFARKLPAAIPASGAALAVASAVFCLALVRSRVALGRRAVLSTLAFEAVGVAFAVLVGGGDGRATFSDAVFYHLVTWLIVPFEQARTRSRRAAWTYAGQTAVVILVFFAFTPAVHLTTTVTPRDWVYASNWLAYFHILSSFALSSMNPRWIRRQFGLLSQASASPAIVLPRNGVTA